MWAMQQPDAWQTQKYEEIQRSSSHFSHPITRTSTGARRRRVVAKRIFGSFRRRIGGATFDRRSGL